MPKKYGSVCSYTMITWHVCIYPPILTETNYQMWLLELKDWLTRRIAKGGLSLLGRWCSMANTTQFAMIVKRTVYSNGVHGRKRNTNGGGQGVPISSAIGSCHCITKGLLWLLHNIIQAIFQAWVLKMKCSYLYWMICKLNARQWRIHYYHACEK